MGSFFDCLSRIVNVANAVQKPVDWEDLKWTKRKYSGLDVVVESKTLELLFANGMARKIPSEVCIVNYKK